MLPKMLSSFSSALTQGEKWELDKERGVPLLRPVWRCQVVNKTRLPFKAGERGEREVAEVPLTRNASLPSPAEMGAGLLRATTAQGAENAAPGLEPAYLWKPASSLSHLPICCSLLAPPHRPHKNLSVSAHNTGWLIIHARPPDLLPGIRPSQRPAGKRRLQKVWAV